MRGKKKKNPGEERPRPWSAGECCLQQPAHKASRSVVKARPLKGRRSWMGKRLPWNSLFQACTQQLAF